MISGVSKIYLTKTVGKTEMKHGTQKEILQTGLFTYLRSDVASVMTVRSKNVDLTVKWRIKLNSMLYAEVPFHRICDHCSLEFSEEVS